jgi:ferredoxin
VSGNCLQTSSSFIRSKPRRLAAVPEWTTTDGINPPVESEVPMVTVRFINTVGGKDIVAVVEQGSNLLFVGDQAGVKLPRSCRTGLCASCTCEVQDPMAIATLSNPRDVLRLFVPVPQNVTFLEEWKRWLSMCTACRTGYP